LHYYALQNAEWENAGKFPGNAFIVAIYETARKCLSFSIFTFEMPSGLTSVWW